MLTGPLIELNSETFIAVKAHHSVGAPLLRYESRHQGRGDHPPVWVRDWHWRSRRAQASTANRRRTANGACAGLRLAAAAVDRLGILAIITSAGGHELRAFHQAVRLISGSGRANLSWLPQLSRRKPYTTLRYAGSDTGVHDYLKKERTAPITLAPSSRDTSRWTTAGLVGLMELDLGLGSAREAPRKRAQRGFGHPM